MATYNYSITSDANDGVESSGTTWADKNESPYPSGEFFEMFGSATPATDHKAAFRFIVADVAQAAVITSATLEIEVTAVLSISVNSTLTTYGDDVDNSGALGAGHRPSSGWTNTTANTVTAAPGSATRLQIDVTAIVQEIVDRGGWAAGNGMSFAVHVTGSDNYWSITVVDHDPDTLADVATLQIVTAASGEVAATPHQNTDNTFGPAISARLGGVLQ